YHGSSSQTFNNRDFQVRTLCSIRRVIATSRITRYTGCRRSRARGDGAMRYSEIGADPYCRSLKSKSDASVLFATIGSLYSTSGRMVVVHTLLSSRSPVIFLITRVILLMPWCTPAETWAVVLIVF